MPSRAWRDRMAFSLISFPSGEMQLDDGGLEQASIDSHQVIRDAKAAGVYVFGGGIDESVPPVRVAAVRPGVVEAVRARHVRIGARGGDALRRDRRR